MDFLSSVEDRIDRWFRRIFAHRRGEEAVQPVEIAREIAKAMEGMRQVSVDAVYVPNHFEVRLHPLDVRRIAPVQRTVQRDCITYAVQTAKKRRLSFAGPVTMELIVDESVPPGGLRVLASFREDGAESADEDGPTRRFTRSSSGVRQVEDVDGNEPGEGTRVFPAMGHALVSGQASLLVVSGDHEQEGLLLVPGRSYTVGRGEDNDLRLTDVRVSRRHARLVFEGGSWWIEDLQTTNGTLKNGVALRRERLQDGDELTMGLTVLRFRERAARR